MEIRLENLKIVHYYSAYKKRIESLNNISTKIKSVRGHLRRIYDNSQLTIGIKKLIRIRIVRINEMIK